MIYSDEMIKPLILIVFLATIEAVYFSDSDVITVTLSNFDRFVIKSDQIWIVEFYAPWCAHCKALEPEFTKAAAALKGVVKFAAVNGEENRKLCDKYGVDGYPTIKIFGYNKKKPEDYNGVRTAQGLAEAALQAIKTQIRVVLGSAHSRADNDVVELTDTNFDTVVLESEDMWLVEFYAPWCGHCKNLAPHWAKAASELNGKMKLGALDATVHKTQALKYKVDGFPTIKFFPSGKKSSSSVYNYDGGRTSNDIVQWALQKVAENLPDPDVEQIINQNTLEQACRETPLCIVAFLPHLYDCQSECRNNYISLLKDLGRKFKKNMWGWLWSEAGAQRTLEKALEVGGFGYPAMVVINARKMKYSLLRGAFSKKGITEFLKELSQGRGSTSPVKEDKLPKIRDIQLWDGKDWEIPEEYTADLSDFNLDIKDEF